MISALLRSKNSSERVSTIGVKRTFHWRKSGKSTRNMKFQRRSLREWPIWAFL